MSTKTLPVVDIRDLRRPDTARAIDFACREWGFFQVVGHGIDERILAALRREMRSFFYLPLSAKRAVVRTAENPWGFYDRELTKHTRDWKQIYDYGPPDGGAIVRSCRASCRTSLVRSPSSMPRATRFRSSCSR
jgi:isopenicillin N synthase-like dioxygenase